jgi:thiol-disulfide isomerase/thioredoxin
LALEAESPEADFRLLAISMDDPYSEGWVTEFKAKHFPTLMSFINAELDMDTLVSVIDPVWNETLPTSYIINRDGEVVKKVQGKKPIAFFREQLVAAGL